jgi:hypothetical protein
MQCVTRVCVVLALTTSAGLITVAPALAKASSVHCQQHARSGQCVVTVRSRGHGGGGESGTGGDGGSRCTDASGGAVSCVRAGLGTWDQGLHCYLRLMRPQPAKSDPVWQGKTNGAVYLCTAWPPNTTGIEEIWLADPPSAVNPRALALDAERGLVLPQPTGHRSPDESQRFQGYPFTYVNLWTWFWTSPGTWRARSATAQAGRVSATVTVTPTRLTFDPGDGSGSVSCAGPGRAWSSADGNNAPSGGGCGYRYRTATNVPVVSTQSIRWSVMWTASDGASGMLPALTTSSSGQLMVLQIESVVSR